VDVVASRGSQRLAVQVKHYSSAVSGKAIAEALLGMPHYGCNACMVVTNSRFTTAAVKAAALHPCTLVDRHGLARWLADAQAPQRTGGRHSHGYAALAGQGFFNGDITAQKP
jgi:HJR/Mrr/RecB family endonuclease